MTAIYYPYFRGKQFELLTIRENTELFSSSNFCPIIEPVNETYSGLRKAIEAMATHHVPYILIANPKCTSETVGSPKEFIKLANDISGGDPTAQVGVLMDESSNLDELKRIMSIVQGPAVVIHDGFSDGKQLAETISEFPQINTNIFIQSKCGKLYQRHFKSSKKVIIHDGFNKQQKNSAYPFYEAFSDLHLLYKEEGANGFGDFLIAGKEFSEGGGPAWAVAIHITVIDPTKEEVMMIYHFVSDKNDTNTNPGGKFLEALGKLVNQTDQDSNILNTSAIHEFLELNENKHFPGLGYVKKLSMLHHLEVMSNFLRK